MYPQAKKYDGVFGIWYGKGPGVDRCSDVFEHADMAGARPAWRRDAIAGDDHVAKAVRRRPPERPHLQGLRHAVFFPAACRKFLDMGLTPCHEPLLGRVVGHEDHPGGGGVLGQHLAWTRTA